MMAIRFLILIALISFFGCGAPSPKKLGSPGGNPIDHPTMPSIPGFEAGGEDDSSSTSDHGGFEISRTSLELLKRNSKSLSRMLKNVEEEHWIAFSNLFSLELQISGSRLSEIVANVDSRIYLEQDFGKNQDGGLEPKIMTYTGEVGKESFQIRPTLLYFEVFASKEMSPQTDFEVMQLLLHEALHFYDIGEEGNLARRISNTVINNLLSNFRCLELTNTNSGFNCHTLSDPEFNRVGGSVVQFLTHGEIIKEALFQEVRIFPEGSRLEITIGGSELGPIDQIGLKVLDENQSFELIQDRASSNGEKVVFYDFSSLIKRPGTLSMHLRDSLPFSFEYLSAPNHRRGFSLLNSGAPIPELGIVTEILVK